MNKKPILICLILWAISLNIYSQDVTYEVKRILSFINELSFPVKSSTLQSYLIKSPADEDGVFYYDDYIIPDTMIYYMYRKEFGDLTLGKRMRGADITHDFLYLDCVALGYTKTDNYILIYYLGLENEGSVEIYPEVYIDVFDFRGKRINCYSNSDKLKLSICSTFSFDWIWMNVCSSVINDSVIKTKVVSLEYPLENDTIDHSTLKNEEYYWKLIQDEENISLNKTHCYPNK